MAAKIYYDSDATSQALEGKRIAVLGYGSQGRAHALNLKDSGHRGRRRATQGLGNVGPRPKPTECESPASTRRSPTPTWSRCCFPISTRRAVYRRGRRAESAAGRDAAVRPWLLIHFGQIRPPEDNDVVMIAPKAPARSCAEPTRRESGTPALVAVHQDATGQATERALAYAQGSGARAPV